MRKEALVGLKDLFQLHENLLEENLGIIIKRVAEKMTDSDPSVRQSLLLLFCFIFPLVPQERMAPFSPLVMAHLSCAMTHIYDDIQHDSLGFLELCLQYFPNLMVASSSQLIHNFIGMISYQDTSGTKKSKGLQQNVGKGLSVNPKGKLSSLRSRLKVLQQLLAFLKALESSSNSCQAENSLTSMDHVDVSSNKPIFHFQKHLPTQIQVLQHSVEEPRLPPFTFENTFGIQSVNTRSESSILTDGQQTKDFMETIVPLLLECWVECNPAQMTTGLPDSVMSPSSVNVMLAIAEICKVIFKAAERNQSKDSNILEQTKAGNFLHDIYKELNHHFMSHFPFTASHTPLLKKEKKRSRKSSQQDVGDKISSSVLTLNLAICEVMLQFVRDDVALRKKYHASVQKLEDFVIESLLLKAKGGAWAQQFQSEHVESLIKFAHQILCGKQGNVLQIA